MKSTNTDKEKISHKVAKVLFEAGSVVFRPKQPFRFDSGILSPVYVDNRLLISQPLKREKIIRYFIELIREIGTPEVIAGTATAGIPHAAWIAQKLGLPMIYVRSKPKDHGRGNQVEGLLKRGQGVLVIEDMVSTAGSSARVIEAIRKEGGIVKDEVAIYTHNLLEAKENFKKLKVKFHYLTSLDKVADVVLREGFLKADQIDMINDWSKNPKAWGKKMGFE